MARVPPIIALFGLITMACPAPETAIRLRLVYDDAWALTELTVSTPARQSRVRAEHEVYLLPEASSLGRPMMLRLVGQRGSVPFASGRVTVTPLQDQVVTAEVRLSRLPCGAWCTEGSTVCTGDSVEVCVVDSVGCSAWTQVEVCAEPTTCSLGQCRAACIDECALGDRECAGPSGVRECRSDGDSDACNDWVFVTACAEGETCSRGLCGDECVSECAMGAVRCSLGGVSRCGDLDDDGCLEWGPSLPCEAGESCEGGACAPVESCEDECTMSECAGTVYRQCGNFDLDGCREWSAGTDCAATTGCVAGRCTAGGCETAPRVCEPLDPQCLDANTVRRFEPGVCVDGDCSYRSSEVPCPGCVGGRCSGTDSGGMDAGVGVDASSFDTGWDARAHDASTLLDAHRGHDTPPMSTPCASGVGTSVFVISFPTSLRGAAQIDHWGATCAYASSDACRVWGDPHTVARWGPGVVFDSSTDWFRVRFSVAGMSFGRATLHVAAHADGSGIPRLRIESAAHGSTLLVPTVPISTHREYAIEWSTNLLPSDSPSTTAITLRPEPVGLAISRLELCVE